jgi:hypothetical protein
MTEANEELVNTLTLAAATIVGGLIQVGQFREHDLQNAIERAAQAAIVLREKIQQTV